VLPRVPAPAAAATAAAASKAKGGKVTARKPRLVKMKRSALNWTAPDIVASVLQGANVAGLYVPKKKRRKTDEWIKEFVDCM
jgi:hypothetical protein